jgi:hypothetical protein
MPNSARHRTQAAPDSTDRPRDGDEHGVASRTQTPNRLNIISQTSLAAVLRMARSFVQQVMPANQFLPSLFARKAGHTDMVMPKRPVQWSRTSHAPCCSDRNWPRRREGLLRMLDTQLTKFAQLPSHSAAPSAHSEAKQWAMALILESVKYGGKEPSKSDVEKVYAGSLLVDLQQPMLSRFSCPIRRVEPTNAKRSRGFTFPLVNESTNSQYFAAVNNLARPSQYGESPTEELKSSRKQMVGWISGVSLSACSAFVTFHVTVLRRGAMIASTQ